MDAIQSDTIEIDGETRGMLDAIRGIYRDVVSSGDIDDSYLIKLVLLGAHVDITNKMIFGDEENAVSLLSNSLLAIESGADKAIYRACRRTVDEWLGGGK